MRRPLQRLRQTAGVTLVETLVSITLLGICIGSVGSMMSSQIRMAGTSYMSTQAYAMIEKEFEAMRALDYDDMVSRSSTQTMGAVTYSMTTTVTADNPSPNMKTIVVNVSWTQNTGSKNVSVSTIYSQVRR